MDRKRNSKVDILENRSLGFLNLADCRVYGVSSKNNVKSARTSAANDRLVLERAKAHELMKKMDTNSSDSTKLKDTSSNKENAQSFDSPDLYRTDYEPYRLPHPINISDLMVENTSIESLTNIPTDTKAAKISFEPSEITGRSTHIYTDVQKQRKSSVMLSERLSVDDILSSSFAPKVRNLRESTRSSSSIYYNGTHSLPRTADMSKNSSNAEFGAIANSFGSNFDNNCSAFNAEDFAPGELMESKLIAGEISWAQKRAAIPTAVLSKVAKEKARKDGMINAEFFDSISVSNSIVGGDVSDIGKYFNERLENLSNILPNRYSDKFNTPKALIDACSDTSDVLTPKVDNKTYSKYERFASRIEGKSTKNHDSKDSGNASDNSFMLSMSAIDRALANLDLQSDDSPTVAVKKFFEGTKKPHFPASNSTLEPITETHLKNYFEQSVDRVLENKENLDPKVVAGHGALSDTLSFTESILNSSDLRKDESSINKSRSPLSSLENATPKIHVTGDVTTNEADVDEWPSPPIKSEGRRVTRRKSPKDKDINPCRAAAVAHDSSPDTITTTNKSPGVDKLNINLNAAMFDNVPSTHGKPCGSQWNGSPLASSNSSPISSPGRGISPHASSPFQSSPHRMCSATSPNRCLLNVDIANKEEDANTRQRHVGAVSASSTEKLEALRSTSPYSCCSEFSHRDGKVIPIKLTALSLSWVSAKLRVAAHKTIQVKNTSKKRLVLRAEAHGPGFQMVNTQNTSNITLHPQECRTITISFCPTVTGVAIGDLSLYSPHGTTSNNAPYLQIPLYAFGGHTSIKILETLRAPDNSLYLPMGNVVELPRPLEKTFKLHNKGPSLGFALIFVDSSSLNLTRDADSFEIQPRRVLIRPDCSVIIRVVFNPKREYIRKIQKKANIVQNLGNLSILSGNEVNRQRMRRIVKDMPLNKRADVLGITTSSCINELLDVFPNEIELSELEALKDDTENANVFLSASSLHELALTLNFDELNDTAISSTHSCRDADETVIFRSPNPRLTPNKVDEHLLDKSVYSVDESAVSSTQEVSWSVYPNFINFDMNDERRKDSFLIRNFYKSRQYFEVSCNVKNLLIFTPSEGYVEPDGGEAKINVSTINKEPHAEIPKSGVMINVYIENERMTIPVKFFKDKH